MTYPLMLIVPINVSINKHVYGRIVGIDFGTQTIERLFCVSSLHCENATEDAAEIVDEVGNAAKSDDVDCSLHDTIETEQHEDALARLAISNDTEDAAEIVDEVGNAAKSDDVDCSLHYTIEKEQHEDALAPLAISNDTEDIIEITDEIANAEKSDDIGVSFHGNFDTEQNDNHRLNLVIV